MTINRDDLPHWLMAKCEEAGQRCAHIRDTDVQRTNEILANIKELFGETAAYLFGGALNSYRETTTVASAMIRFMPEPIAAMMVPRLMDVHAVMVALSCTTLYNKPAEEQKARDLAQMIGVTLKDVFKAQEEINRITHETSEMLSEEMSKLRRKKK